MTAVSWNFLTPGPAIGAGACSNGSMIDRRRLAERHRAETERFEAEHPASAELFGRTQRHLLGGVPMNWMRRWPGPFPLFVEEAVGSRVRDVDGHTYVVFCLGDTGAMTGHAIEPMIEALRTQAPRGVTAMLPTADALAVGRELTARFGLPIWQLAMTATDANRFAVRLARHLTERPKVLVFNWCYHGTVDETFAVLDAGGHVVARPGSIGAPVEPAVTTQVVEFNDVDALAAALERRDVACVLTEPALTNIGIVLPDPGFHDELRALTRRTGTLLVIDETHTLCTGPGGYTAAHALEPDLLTVGKPLAGGIPAAAYGMRGEIADRLAEFVGSDDTDVSGIGGTLTANALSVAAMRAVLESTLKAPDYERTIPLARRWADGVEQVIEQRGLPWSVQQLGCRAEYWFCPPPRNGGEAAAAVDHELDAYFHLAALNRGILLTPFHNMALMAPTTTEDDVDRHTEVFAETVMSLVG
jgi:glutamate-1-semialdehyde 2,1-aminomutase